MSEPFSKMLRDGGSPAHGFWEVAETALDDMTVEEAHVWLADSGVAERDERGVLTEPRTGLTDVRWAEDLLDGFPEPDPVLHPEPGNRHQVHCLCGRFAKYVGDQHYYNGQFDCYRYTVRCSRCGDVDIECV